APHLTDDNHRSVLESAHGKRRREVEVIVARLCPRPDVPSSIRKLPSAHHTPVPRLDAAAQPETPPPTTPRVPQAHQPTVTPLAPERYKLQVTISGHTV